MNDYKVLDYIKQKVYMYVYVFTNNFGNHDRHSNDITDINSI